MLKWNDIVNFANHGNPTPVRKVVKTDQQWRELLNEEQYYVTRKRELNDQIVRVVVPC